MSASSNTMIGALPPSSRCRRLTRVGGDLRDTLAGDRVAGDRDHPDLRVADQRVADVVARARQDVDHAWRQDLGEDLGEGEGGQRRSGRRLEHDRIAGRERRARASSWPCRAGSSTGRSTATTPIGSRRMIDVWPASELVGRKAVHHACCAGEEAEQVDQTSSSRRSRRRPACRRSRSRAGRAHRPWLRAHRRSSAGAASGPAGSSSSSSRTPFRRR